MDKISSLLLFDILEPSSDKIRVILQENCIEIDRASSDNEIVSFATHQLPGEFAEIFQIGNAYYGCYDHSEGSLEITVWHDYRICNPRNHYHDDYNKIRSIITRSRGQWHGHGSHYYNKSSKYYDENRQPYHYAVWLMNNCRLALYQAERDIGYNMCIRYIYRDGDVESQLYTEK